MSNIKDAVQLKGTVSIMMTDRDGNIVESRELNNLIVTRGKALMTYLLGALSSSVKPDYMAVGTGVVAPDPANTQLGIEVYREIINSYTAVTTTTTDDTIQYVMQIGEGELTSGAITEAGLFGSISGFVAGAGANTGYLLSRVTFPAINKTSSLTLTITWRIQQL